MQHSTKKYHLVKFNLVKFSLLLATLMLPLSVNAIKTKSGIEISSQIELETRYFFKSPIDNRQSNSNYSLSFETEIYKEWKAKNLSLTITPFYRQDKNDERRTHGDLRDFLLHKTNKKWELKIGISKVYWGVTESQHLVDIINQTDQIESSDGEEKLGQPMVHLILKAKSSTLDLFILPYFRERTFPGVKGRLRPSPPIETDLVQYESSKKQRHVDYALRWSKTIKIWDIGLSYFSGTSRAPSLLTGKNNLGNTVFIPRYNQISQTGLDLQATLGKWLWKLEAIHNRSQSNQYSALTAGFEYTYNGILKSRADLGLLMEYSFDDRHDPALTAFNDDLMLAGRITFNNASSSELLFGVTIDIDLKEKLYFLEFSRRIKQNYKLSIESRFLSNSNSNSILFGQRNENYFQIELKHYF